MPTSVVFDSFETTPEYAPLREAVAAESWPQFEAVVAGWPADQAGFALTALAEVDGIESWLAESVSRYPSSAFARTALAARYIVLAWASRGRAHAPQTSDEQFMGFFEWLAEADPLIAAVVEEHPDFAPAWSAGLTSARGLQLGKHEVLGRYSMVAAISPRDFPAQTQLLQSLLPKWSGSWEEAESFVREATSSPALVPLLHLERWVDSKPAQARAYLRSAAVLADLREAATRLPDAPLNPVLVQEHNTFLMAFYLAGQNADAERHLHVLGGRVTEFPWRYAAGTQAVLEKVHRDILRQKRGLFGRTKK